MITYTLSEEKDELTIIKVKNLTHKQKAKWYFGQEILTGLFLKDKLVTSHQNSQDMPYNTKNPMKSTLNTGTNLSGIVSFMDTSLFHLARGIKLTFHFGRRT